MSTNGCLKLKFGHTRPLISCRLFSVFPNNQTINFLLQINVKNIYPVSGPGIWTHDLLNTSRLPQSLDQGSLPDLNLSLFDLTFVPT